MTVNVYCKHWRADEWSCLCAAITNTYKVTVHTGNVFGAGTDANVYIVFVGEIDETGLYNNYP